MSDLETTTTLRRPILGAFKALAPALAIATGCMMAAAPSQAATYVLQNGSMETSRTLNIAGIGNVRAAPVKFDGYIDDTVDTPFVDLVAFCVDVYHRISLGDYNPDLTYTDLIPLTTDSNFSSPIILSQPQITQIGRLVNFGTALFYNAPTTTSTQRNLRYDQLAAVQGAIWQVASGRNVTSTKGSINTLIDNLGGANYQNFTVGYGPISSNITLITPFTDTKEYPYKKLTQAFAIAGSVPEPATWAMMIMGFGVAGLVLRRSRRQMAAAA